MSANQSVKESIRELYQIIAFGNIIPSIPFGEKLAEFVFEAFKGIKKIENCIVCLETLQKPVGDLIDEKCNNCKFFDNPNKYSCSLDVKNGLRILPVNTFQNRYANIAFKVNSDFSEDLLAALYNFSNSLAITIENHLQKSALVKYNSELILYRNNLEELVEQRTKELKQQNEEYLSLNEEYKSQNEELINAKEKAVESNRLKTEFINNMSHEIRTPMNGILGFINFLLKPNLTDDKRKHYINIIQSSGKQLLRIIDDILEISKLSTKQVKVSENEVCLNDLLLELFSIFDIKAKENKTPLYLKRGLSDKESFVYTDKSKLNKILCNLLENSLKFTYTGFIEIGYQLINNEIIIYVTDTGIGINPDKQEIIFERFLQDKNESSEKISGLGLGLSIAKENAELLGGKITLKSEKGKGSTFFVTIPFNLVYKDTEISSVDNKKGIGTKKQDKYSILIAEDDEVNYLYLETLLKDEFELKCNIFHAKNGQDAVNMCRDHGDFDFVLMDLKLPVMNGYEATKQIKEFHPDLLIVAQTAFSTLSEKEMALSAGCNDFISKPINEETLTEIINKYLIKK